MPSNESAPQRTKTLFERLAVGGFAGAIGWGTWIVPVVAVLGVRSSASTVTLDPRLLSPPLNFLLDALVVLTMASILAAVLGSVGVANLASHRESRRLLIDAPKRDPLLKNLVRLAELSAIAAFITAGLVLLLLRRAA